MSAYPESDADVRRLCPDILMSDDFAVLLGLKESVFKDGRGARDEIEKIHFLMFYIRRNKLEHEQQQDIIWCRFCALYLPSTVSRFLDPPHLTGVTANAEFIAEFKLNNAYLEMLVQVQHTPYFAKYLRSSKPIAADGRRLPRVLAERLLEQAPRWDRKMLEKPADRPTFYYESIAASCVQLLSTLLTSFVKEADQETVVPTVTRQGMLPWLSKWARRYNGDVDTLLGDVSIRTHMQLSPNSGIQDEVRRVRKVMKNWDVCALPTCGEKANTKACGKCQTVCYCCPEHQRAHWRFPIGAQHKQLCHPTEY